MSRTDERDRRRAMQIVLGTSALAALLVALVVLAAATSLPAISDWVSMTFDQGIGLKTAALWAVIVSVIILLLFAVAAGDGLIGEIQFIIPGFFLFFVFFWLMLAWIF
jgi:hypothetical protein